ncbi:MAG: nitrate reductase associated protein [Cyanobacteria bacterium SBLK]|nr:nitrate reductase associated protein [Cyanobacteria bacterium SBLK]
MFQFEADFVESLRCIPMQVRMKLDTCGVKLKLIHWNQFDLKTRETLVIMPCETEAESKTYRDYLQKLVIQSTGKPASTLPIDRNPPWLNETEIPNTVGEKAREMDVSLSLEQWQSLTPDRRFALIKLSRPSHENKNFLPAMKEFGLLAEKI